MTAPYAIGATWRDGAVILSGRVGTKQVHDAAVQMAIAFGFRFRDDLVIDTAETVRVAMSATPSMTGYGMLAPNLSASYYVYPQPLFGWLDDPFFGMQPPVVSFAPWWRARRDVAMAGPPGAQPMPAAAAAGMVGIQPNPNLSAFKPVGNPEPAANPAGGGQPLTPGPAGAMELPPVKGDVEITVDAAGQVFLRGVVASEDVAREIEQTAWSVPGVSRVVTQFQVKPRHSGTADSRRAAPAPAARLRSGRIGSWFPLDGTRPPRVPRRIARPKPPRPAPAARPAPDQVVRTARRR